MTASRRRSCPFCGRRRASPRISPSSRYGSWYGRGNTVWNFKVWLIRDYRFLLFEFFLQIHRMYCCWKFLPFAMFQFRLICASRVGDVAVEGPREWSCLHICLISKGIDVPVVLFDIRYRTLEFYSFSHPVGLCFMIMWLAGEGPLENNQDSIIGQ